MVNYGLAYGMNAWGLAQRLDIAPDEAQAFLLELGVQESGMGALRGHMRGANVREGLGQLCHRGDVDGDHLQFIGGGRLGKRPDGPEAGRQDCQADVEVVDRIEKR